MENKKDVVRPFMKWLLVLAGISLAVAVFFISQEGMSQLDFNGVQGLVKKNVTPTPINTRVTPTPSASVLTPMAETAGWKTYSSLNYGFSVKYPNNWEVGETQYENNGGTLIGFNQSDNYGSFSAIDNKMNIEVGNLENQTFTEYIDSMISNPNLTSSKPEDRIIGNNLHTRYLIISSGTGGAYSYIMKHPTKKGWQVTFSFHEENDINNLIIRQIISSVKFAE